MYCNRIEEEQNGIELSKTFENRIKNIRIEQNRIEQNRIEKNRMEWNRMQYNGQNRIDVFKIEQE